MKTNIMKIAVSTFIGGFLMWVIAGLYHNLILPQINPNIEAHHEGIFIMLIAYFILALLMGLLFLQIKEWGNYLIRGLFFGIIIGVLWVFPHGLAMAGAHETSIIYEIKNALYHIIEQGAGGVIIAFFQRIIKTGKK